MSPQTEIAIKALCKADATITHEQLRAALADLAGVETPNTNPAQVLGRVVKPRAAAAALGVTTRTLSRRIAAGQVKAVYTGKGDKRRVTGVTVASLNAYMEGNGKEVC